MKDVHILLLDIETSPLLGYTWGVWEQDVIETEQDWYILSYAAKWYGEKKVTVRGLCDFEGYEPGAANDQKLVEELHSLFGKADFIVAHNGDRFDIKKCNARFATHCLPPPEPYKTIDTLKIARRHFQFSSNKLDDLGHLLHLGRKKPTTGKHLWLGCMRGDLNAWKKMKAYNKQDVVLLERVYDKLRGWAVSHPNLNVETRGMDTCKYCLSKNIEWRGYGRTLNREYRRFQCRDCGGWGNNFGEPLPTRPLR